MNENVSYSPFSIIFNIIPLICKNGASNVSIELDLRTGGYLYLTIEHNGRNTIVQKEASGESLVLDERVEFVHLLLHKRVIEITKKPSTTELAIGIKAHSEYINSTKFKKIVQPIKNEILVINGLISRTVVIPDEINKIIGSIQNLVNHFILLYETINFNIFTCILDSNGNVLEKTQLDCIQYKISKRDALCNYFQIELLTSNFVLSQQRIQVDDGIKLDFIIPIFMKNDINNIIKEQTSFFSMNGNVILDNMAIHKKLKSHFSDTFKTMDLQFPKLLYLNIQDGESGSKTSELNVDRCLDKVFIIIFEFFSKLIGTELTKRKSSLSSTEKPKPKNLSNSELKEKYEFKVPCTKEDEPVCIISNLQNKTPWRNLLSDTKNKMLVDDISYLQAFPPKKSSVTVYNIDDEEDYTLTELRTLDRNQTNSSLVSEEGTWCYDFLREDHSDQTYEIEDVVEQVSSDYFKDNEDLELLNDTSVSNPFLIAKLRRSSKIVNDSNPKMFFKKKVRKNNLTKKLQTHLNKDSIIDDDNLLNVLEDVTLVE